MPFQVPDHVVVCEYEPQRTRAIQKFYPKGISCSAFQRAWDAGFTGNGIKVAIIDTGVDGSHRDLAGKVIKSFNLTGEALSESHGTHVAGTIAGNGWIIGGAPGCSIIDIKVLGKNGGTIANIVKAISLAAANGASVINMSLGGSGISNSDIQSLKVAIQNAWNNGAVCVVASGNAGTSINTRDGYSYPAAIDQAESIAACDVAENLRTITLAKFSNENDKVDVAACGVGVLSTIIGGKYAVYNGTSMATPHVSAMAAVIAQSIKKSNPSLRGAAFSDALVRALNANVLPISAKIASPVGNISYGRGFIRYLPNNGPVVPSGSAVYSGPVFLGHIA